MKMNNISENIDLIQTLMKMSAKEKCEVQIDITPENTEIRITPWAPISTRYATFPVEAQDGK